ncbi:hypothetical protein [Bdellovibrio reynosensis]|uniref:Ig-like domain-containing protein n=1 Tax=Bdellovibrio reynosensis TaxID=2835041 RepID=A0ABY4CDW6_9BACT|nr:hypothetical protein [Bdellovibrio reynosensis]UOF01861.1 hypothetical protein MNR06_02695 [Bdellovibrio reynosensis]
MKAFITAILLASTVAQAGELEISANESVWAIPTPAMSCLAAKNPDPVEDISSAHIRLGNVSFNWTDTDNDFVITSIKVKMVDNILSGGSYECTTSGAALEALSNELNWTTIPAGTTKETDCNLICGGISFVDNTPATVNGKIEVHGYKQNKSGEQTQAIYALPITVDNL